MDCLPGPPDGITVAVPRIFRLKKRAHFCLFGTPFYFRSYWRSGGLWASGQPGDCHFSMLTGRLLNCTIFSCLKQSFFQNTGFNEESPQVLAPLPLEIPGHQKGHPALRRRIDHGRLTFPPPAPLYKGGSGPPAMDRDSLPWEQATYRECGFLYPSGCHHPISATAASQTRSLRKVRSCWVRSQISRGIHFGNGRRRTSRRSSASRSS
jgi:hypothetical protein